MSQASTRQVSLLSGEDWRVLYRAFTAINFNASDPVSVNGALRQYIARNYPEDFNDWIESSEFVAIIDLLSWLAGLLAFRTDINAHENFSDTAESRESILRLARFLSYTPRRNLPARGLVKIVAVQTNDDLVDGFGNNLNNASIQWNDPDNPDWFEQFTLVLNNALIGTNPFGIPLKNGLVGDIKSQLYRLNTTSATNAVFPFEALAGGDSRSYELVNMDFEVGGSFSERVPDYESAFHLSYRNDGNGNASANTGFFMLFKQGTLNQQVYRIDTPQENRVIDINTANINENDVWVQTVSDSGLVLSDWTKVPALITDNITFNALPVSVRNVYQVITRTDDQISLRFSDGRFGTVPVGNLRIWYRVSAGDQTIVRPQDIDRVQVVIPYLNRRNVEKSLIVTFSLQDTVANAVSAETDEQIRRRATQVFATQNRMVSGEDYNTFPLSSNLAVKLKAVNRTYAGHSRFIDINDPTGTYQDTNVFGDDGIVYVEDGGSYDALPNSSNKTPEQMVSDYIQPRLSAQPVANYLLDTLLKLDPPLPEPTDIYWMPSSVAKFSSTGLFTSVPNSVGDAIKIGKDAAGLDDTTAAYFMNEGALVKLDRHGWVSLASVSGDGDTLGATGKGPVQLSQAVEGNPPVERVLPAIRTTLTADERTLIEGRLEDRFSFNLFYHWPTLTWEVANLDVTTLPDAIKVMSGEYIGGMWRFVGAGLRYVFESVRQVRWFFDEGYRAVDIETGAQQRDLVRVFSTNPSPITAAAAAWRPDFGYVVGDVVSYGGSYYRCRSDHTSTSDFKQYDFALGRELWLPISLSLETDYDLILDKRYLYPDGFAEPRRVQVTFSDANFNGVPDDPETFIRLANQSEPSNLLFWSRYSDSDDNLYYKPLEGVTVFENSAARNSHTGTAGGVYYVLADDTFWRWDSVQGTWAAVTDHSYRVGRGRGGNGLARFIEDSGAVTQYSPVYLRFQWKHFAPADHRIDPSPTNVIDCFVLDTTYDTLTRQWIRNGSDPRSVPTPPSELDLKLTFIALEQNKMFSDEMVWRPVKYKFLFGSGADDELRAQLKVVKLPNTALSDGEIKSQVVRAVNNFFDVRNWDFGETFFYTELAAYVHQQLANIIGSVVLVPSASDAEFGDLFEIHCASDEIFVSTTQVSDIVIVPSNTPANMRMR